MAKDEFSIDQNQVSSNATDARGARFHELQKSFCNFPLSIRFDIFKSWEYRFSMSSLLEIEEAADVLPIEEKKQLVAFLLTRLRRTGDELPPVRDIPKATIDKWVADDEEGYRKFLAEA